MRHGSRRPHVDHRIASTRAIRDDVVDDGVTGPHRTRLADDHPSRAVALAEPLAYAPREGGKVSGGRAMALNSIVNACIGGQIGGMKPGDTYTRVTVVSTFGK
jgi:hypothetical protein